MSHKEQRMFIGDVRDKFPKYFVGGNVVDFGSLDINGNNKVFFDLCNYTGVDIGEGETSM